LPLKDIFRSTDARLFPYSPAFSRFRFSFLSNFFYFFYFYFQIVCRVSRSKSNPFRLFIPASVWRIARENLARSRKIGQDNDFRAPSGVFAGKVLFSQNHIFVD
jgi:hypothetical protein